MYINPKDSFKNCCDIYAKNSHIIGNSLDFRIFQNFFLALMNDSPFSDREIYILQSIHLVVMDIQKAFNEIMQGRYADHYLYIRRLIDRSQFLMFLLDKDDEFWSENCHKVFEENQKRNFKFGIWLREEKQKKDPLFLKLINDYEKASEFGIHSELKNLMSSQTAIYDGGYSFTTYYCDSDKPNSEPLYFLVLLINLFEVFHTISILMLKKDLVKDIDIKLQVEALLSQLNSQKMKLHGLVKKNYTSSGN